jgi:hypothetical protein
MTTTRHALLAALALGLGVLSAGCEDSPLVAGSDWKMSITANPGSVLDPSTSGNTDIQVAVTLVDAKGVPKQGITVYFNASIKGLVSGQKGVKTDASGTARDVLPVTIDNYPPSVTVPATPTVPAHVQTPDITITATSAGVTETANVTTGKATVNHPPVASIVASPQNQQASGGAVVFDGSASTDPDAGEIVTMYRWVLTSTNPDAGMPNPFIAEGQGVSGLQFPNDTLPAFKNIQDLTVSLFVTEDPNAPADFAAGKTIAYRGQETQVYSIVAVRCDSNTAPTAVLSGADQQQIFGFPQSLVSFQLDGSLSSDPETPIDIYNFSCGNGSAPVPGTSPSKVTCRYLVDAVPRTYTPALTVVDRGTGQIVNGQYQCQKSSQEKTITVTVSPLASGG